MGLRFSVVTPTRDRPDWLPRCLATVEAQDFPDYEHIVFDNGVHSSVEGQVTNPKARYVKGEADGPADAFAQAIDLAQGEIITLLSDDDRMAAGALSKVDAAIGDSEWLVALTDFQNAEGVSQQILGGPVDIARLQADYYLGGAIYWRRALSDRLGQMDRDFDGAADYDLYLRFAKDSPAVFLDEVLYLYTYHPGVDSIVNSSRQQDATRRIKEAR
jgi:glycosyltransferase involved in cell wall biosynthesis